jgi:hypothetical protein
MPKVLTETEALETYNRLCSKRSMSAKEWDLFEEAAAVLEAAGHNLNGWK